MKSPQSMNNAFTVVICMAASWLARPCLSSSSRKSIGGTETLSEHLSRAGLTTLLIRMNYLPDLPSLLLTCQQTSHFHTLIKVGYNKLQLNNSHNTILQVTTDRQALWLPNSSILFITLIRSLDLSVSSHKARAWYCLLLCKQNRMSAALCFMAFCYPLCW